MTNRPDAGSTLLLLFMTLILGMILAGVTIMNGLGADRWWFGALNMYLPQAIWAIPGISLTVATALVNRRLLWAPLLCVAWVFGPLMGLCWSRQTPPEPGQTFLRVMSCNVKYGRRDVKALFAEIDRERPDLVLFQDATGLLNSSVSDYFREWHIRYYGQYVIASRLPLEEAELRWLNFPGQFERQASLRCRLRIAGTGIVLYNIHFNSPREALSLLPTALKNPPFRDYAVTRLADNAATRRIQAQNLATLLRRETEPVIVAGDLNSPDASLVCATLRDAGLHDAFAQGGRGYGYSYGRFLLPPWAPRFSFVRIDHIMISSQLSAFRSWTGTGNVSDHRPVYADLVLKQAPLKPSR
jgi:vancomycin resistance protein VanJ